MAFRAVYAIAADPAPKRLKRRNHRLPRLQHLKPRIQANRLKIVKDVALPFAAYAAELAGFPRRSRRL